MGVEHPSETDTRIETTDEPSASERPYSPPPDNPGSAGQPSRIEDRARVRQEATPTEPEQPPDEPTDQERDDDSEPSPTGETNSEDPANPILSDVYTDSSGRVRIEPRYGREQTSEPETTERTGLPTREDLDPAGAQGGTPERPAPRAPEDDPADRDPRERDPEKPSSLLDRCRESFAKADDIKDSIDKLVEPSQKHLERVQPTGQSCGVRANNDHVKAEDSQLQAGNAALGIVGTAILAVEAGQHVVRLTRKAIGRDHARN